MPSGAFAGVVLLVSDLSRRAHQNDRSCRAISGHALDAIDFISTVREGDSVAATPESLCGLYVIVDKPRLVSDLQEFLRELGFIAAQPRGDGLDVSIPGSPDTAQARRVVNVYLAIWQAIHPGVKAFIAESNRVSDAA